MHVDNPMLNFIYKRPIRTIGEGRPMRSEERIRILREAKPDSWIAFSSDESKVVAYGDTYSEAVRAAAEKGEVEPVLLKTPEDWSGRVFALCL